MMVAPCSFANSQMSLSATRSSRLASAYWPSLWMCLAMLFAAPAYAGEILQNDVDTTGSTYHLETEAVLHAPYAHVYRLLTDYNHLTALHPHITESTVLETAKDRLKIRVVTEECVLFFCQKVINTQWVWEDAMGDIHAETIPAESNLKSGKMLWRIQAQGDNTGVWQEAQFVPNFWVPPVIGPLLIRHTLAKEAARSMAIIEALAQ